MTVPYPAPADLGVFGPVRTGEEGEPAEYAEHRQRPGLHREDLADGEIGGTGARRHEEQDAEAEAEQLALDPLVAPARVLLRHLPDQHREPGDRRASSRWG